MGKTVQLSDTAIDSPGSDPWAETHNGAVHSFLASVELPTPWLRGGAHTNETEIIIQDSGVLSDEENHRRLQRSTDVQIINNCGANVKAFVVYFSRGEKRAMNTWPMVDKDGGTLTIRGITDSTFYLFGTTRVNRYIWSGVSKFCLGTNQCLRKVELGKLAGGTAQYKACSPKSPEPGTQAYDWLQAHNTRRTSFYAENGLGPKDMRWAPSLAVSAENYASKLLAMNDCQIEHGYQGDGYGGENLAANWGSGRYASPRTVTQVMTAWYDDEMHKSSLSQKYHATQIVFRSSRYVGCGQAEKDMDNGYKCFIQVCRYIAAGNCFANQDRWKDSVLSDTMATRCNGDQCLSLEEGCFSPNFHRAHAEDEEGQ